MVATHCLLALLGIAGSTTARVASNALDFKVFAHRVTFGDSLVARPSFTRIDTDKSRSTVSDRSQPVDPTISTRAQKEIKTALATDIAKDANEIYEVRRGVRKNRERRASGHAPQRRDRVEESVGMPLRDQIAAMIQETLEQYEDALLDPDNTNEELREEVRRFKEQFYEDE